MDILYLFSHSRVDWASLVAQTVKNPPAMWETWVQSLGWEDPLEKESTTHSTILAWRISWTVYSPWGHTESDMTEWLSLLLSLFLVNETSVQFSRSGMSNSLQPIELQQARPPCPSPTLGVHPNPCPLSRWCHSTISSSVVAFSSPQSFPASRSFQMSQLFAWSGQNIGVSASTPVLSMNTQDLSPLGWTDLISLQSKVWSRVFSNTTDQKHQFFGAQLSL